jgi:hypothetical protein
MLDAKRGGAFFVKNYRHCRITAELCIHPQLLAQGCPFSLQGSATSVVNALLRKSLAQLTGDHWKSIRTDDIIVW